jgi:hypothetical protein
MFDERVSDLEGTGAGVYNWLLGFRSLPAPTAV